MDTINQWASTGVGMLGGAMANQTEGSRDAGNAFAQGSLGSKEQQAYLGNRSIDLGTEAIGNYRLDPTQQVQNSSVLGGLYGQNGALSNALSDYNNLNSQGWQLNDQDKTAYGQAAGNIARQFGQNDQSLSQALADRGLSSSGIAGQQFANSLGNKNEQLAGLQMQIAQNRMQMNQQRLGMQQQFINQLGAGANNAVNSQSARNIGTGQALEGAGNYYQGLLGNLQNQSNENLKQQVGTSHPGWGANVAAGNLAGMAASKGSGGGGGMSGMSSFGF